MLSEGAVGGACIEGALRVRVGAPQGFGIGIPQVREGGPAAED